LNTIAGNVNNVSTTYNMGLTVTVEPIPIGTMITEAFSGNLYMYALGWFDDYQWTIDFLGPMYAPSQTYPGPDGWNVPALGALYQDAVKASATGDVATLNKDTDAMNTIANQGIMYLWTFYPLGGWDGTSDAVVTFTSNVAGFTWNPSVQPDGPYFASLAPSSMTLTTTSSAAGAPSSTLITAAAAVVIIIIVAIAAIVLRSRSKKTKT
jgi:ABC-type oligopeptide transport system substrate-binding subunit